MASIEAGGLHIGELDDGVVPIAVMAIIKVMGQEGPSYQTLYSDDLTLVEALGMVGFADVTLRQDLAQEDR